LYKAEYRYVLTEGGTRQSIPPTNSDDSIGRVEITKNIVVDTFMDGTDRTINNISLSKLSIKDEKLIYTNYDNEEVVLLDIK